MSGNENSEIELVMKIEKTVGMEDVKERFASALVGESAENLNFEIDEMR